MSTGLQKQLNGALLGGLFASLFCAHGIVGAATEVEPNDTQAQAQVLVITSTGATVSAMMGTGPGAATSDLDVYAFDGKAGDVPSIMVISDGTWDSAVYLYDSAGFILDSNDDAVSLNPGSFSTLDSRIDSYRLPSDGRYYIAVTPVPRYLTNNFQSVFTDLGVGGSYTLVVQGVTPPAPTPTPTPTPPPSSGPMPLPVTLMIMQWHSEDPQLGKFNGDDPIPVAILSAPGFDAMTIDENSLTFGATGNEKSLLRCKKKGKDVKVDKVEDGVKDLVCYFRPDLAGFQVGDVQGFLNGRTASGTLIHGSAALRFLRLSPKKTESWHKRHHVDPRANH